MKEGSYAVAGTPGPRLRDRKDTRFKDSRPSVFSVLYLTDILYLRKLLKGFMHIRYDLSL